MSHGKQFTLYTHKGGPNGWLVVISMLSVACRILTNNADDRKVVFVLEELGLTYESIYLDFASGENKKPEYTQYNPNGRIPAIIDHKNGDFVLWYIKLSICIDHQGTQFF